MTNITLFIYYTILLYPIALIVALFLYFITGIFLIINKKFLKFVIKYIDK